MKSIRGRYISIFFIILFINFITACQSEEVSKKTEKIKIGVSISNMDEYVFSHMKEAMFDLKDRENAEVIWLNADNEDEKQKKDIDNLLKQKVDIIIINPVDSKKSAELVKKINKANIPVLALDRIVESVEMAGYISADSFRVGMEQAKYLSEQIDHHGEIVILKGDKKNNVSYEITTGNKEILKNNIKINIVLEEWHKDWSAELAEQTVRKALIKYPNLKGILANNSSMAMAAVKVLKEKNMIDKVVTVGADASKEACIAITKDEHNADVDKMPHILGLTAFKAALMIVNDETWYYDQRIENGEYSLPVILTPIILIDKYNIIAMKDRWEELDKHINKME